MTRPPTPYERIHLDRLRKKCPLVHIEATSLYLRGGQNVVRGNSWTVTGSVKGQVTIQYTSAFLSGACAGFRKIYERPGVRHWISHDLLGGW